MEVHDLLSFEASNARVQAIARVALQQRHPVSSCTSYSSALDQALDMEPPPFGSRQYADLYEEASLDPEWMAISLITNAEREGDGAKRLWSLSACSTRDDEAQLLKRHAIDESRHALIYLNLLDLTFPDCVDAPFRLELQSLSPRYSAGSVPRPVEGSPYAKTATIDDYLQMNIAEIRTTIHHIMMRPAIARHCPRSDQRRVTMILDSLLEDELQHIAYTAILIEKIAASLPAGRLTAMMRRRFRDFNEITIEELGNEVFDCSVACCARRPHCRAKAPISADLMM